MPATAQRPVTNRITTAVGKPVRAVVQAHAVCVNVARSTALRTVIECATGRGQPRSQHGAVKSTLPLSRRATAVVAALLVVLAAALASSSPAQAASYRDLKSVRYGTCVAKVGSDPVENFYMYACTHKPAADVNWSVTLDGYYNGHPLWILQRQGSSCLGVELPDAIPHLSCSSRGSADVWEVFTASGGHYVLKSFGLFQSRGLHECLTFSGGPRLGGCSLTSNTDMIYK